jgi:hypothetical protein
LFGCTLDNCRLISTIFDTPAAGLAGANGFNSLLDASQYGFGMRVAIFRFGIQGRHKGNMFKISIADTRSQRKLVVEGTLMGAWIAELGTTWRKASQDLGGRKLVIDLADVTVISPEGEDAIFDLMKNGAKFCCAGVLTRHVLKQLVRRKPKESPRR